MTNTNTNFIVGITGTRTDRPVVTIREFDPAAHPTTQGLTKRAAWTLANRMGQPCKPKRQNRALLRFLAVDGTVRDLGMTPEPGEQPAQPEQPKVEVVAGHTVLPNSVVTPSGQVIAAPAAKPLTRIKGGATEKQFELIQRLRNDAGQPALTAWPTFEQARTMIDTLLAQARERKAAQPTQTAPKAPASPKVPDGRYAVENGSDELRFYVVNTPTEGKWAGYTFVKVMASDEQYPVRNRQEREGILARIAADPKAAMLRYGKELGKCGHCGKTLTSEWRKEGIGPICSQKVGF